MKKKKNRSKRNCSWVLQLTTRLQSNYMPAQILQLSKEKKKKTHKFTNEVFTQHLLLHVLHCARDSDT